ncbi:MAG: helix-hairpin-helix domain-containing protein [Bacteroidetes bacterium]|nr:MAG: helix-hairpin-helix domain-containing protein [Bacteroidota bacterium]
MTPIMRKRIFLFTLCFWGFYASSRAQTDSIPDPPADLETTIEDFSQETDAASFDFEELSENLRFYARHPLNLNKVSPEELGSLGLLTDLQVVQFFAYRQRVGPLVSIYELQAVPGFEVSDIQKILPFVQVGAPSFRLYQKWSEWFRGGDNQLILRWSRGLQKSAGFQSEGGESPAFAGDPNRFYLRFRHSAGTRLSYGITAEKDAGEAFFRGANRQGFDFYSAHFFVRDLSPTLRTLALGDYQLRLGQGLLIQNGFATGKNSLTMDIKKTAPVLRRYASVNESDFMRGVAAGFEWGEKWRAVPFISFRKLDANLLFLPDSLSEASPEFGVSSIQTSGLHRTTSEIADKNAIGKWTAGGRLERFFQSGKVAANVVFYQFDQPVLPTIRPYNQFYFSGKKGWAASLDYEHTFRNLHFFGETARSQNGAIATANGLLVSLDETLGLAFFYRRYPRHFQSVNPKSFGESRQARNESGLYMGLEWRPFVRWKIQAYYDFWRRPWLTFIADAPSDGQEWLAKVTFEKRKKWTAYLRLRGERKYQNARADSPLNRPVPTFQFQSRLHWAIAVTGDLELRTRLDWGWFSEQNQPRQTGFTLFQDLIWKPRDLPFSMSTRYALFDTGGFDVRYYHYENDLLQNFSIPAYYNEGSRFYVNFRFRVARFAWLEARYAQTYWNNQTAFGTGNDQIDGSLRSEIKVQASWFFGS